MQTSTPTDPFAVRARLARLGEHVQGVSFELTPGGVVDAIQEGAALPESANAIAVSWHIDCANNADVRRVLAACSVAWVFGQTTVRISPLSQGAETWGDGESPVRVNGLHRYERGTIHLPNGCYWGIHLHSAGQPLELSAPALVSVHVHVRW